MNLVVPINLQALRVTPNDASLITKRTDLFAGPTTSFEELPWRDANFVDHPGRVSRANVSTNVVNRLADSIEEQLEAGVHLHWALPDGLVRGIQQPDGTLVFPAVPNRWLVTRIICVGSKFHAKQWVVESDRLMTENVYTGSYYPATGAKAVAIPVGWTLVAGTDPRTGGGALYYPPSRRMGQVFELASWQPQATPPGTTPDKVLHLDEIERQANAFAAQGKPSGPLKAVGGSGPAFAAYYPDSRSVFGFHDRLNDVPGGLDLDNTAFQVSYQLVGWHSHEADDPLQSPRFAEALTKATTANRAAPPASQVDVGQVTAGAVLDSYRWHYDPASGTPSRCLYNAQVIGLSWDTTRSDGGDPNFPKCYLTPMGDDPTVRLAVGCSVSGAMAALIRHEWTAWTAANWAPAPGQAPEIGDQIEQDLEYLIDALQLGLLDKVGESKSLPQLEQALHQAGFGSQQGGQLWAVHAKPTAKGREDPDRFDPPDSLLPTDANGLAAKLDALNACQARLEALLDTIGTCQRQIFLDWYHYIAVVGSGQADDDSNRLKEDLKNYISGEILDLWAKLDAAFGLQTAPSPATGNLPSFFSDAGTYLALRDQRYASPSPPPSLAGQIAAAANAVLNVLSLPGYEKFELERIEEARFWQPNDPVVVATGDGLRPAQRNGIAKYLPCRLSVQVLPRLNAESGGQQASIGAPDAAAAFGLATPDIAANPTPEAKDTLKLLDDVRALLGEACLLDYTLAPNWVGRLAGLGEATAAAVPAALRSVVQRIGASWQAGAPDKPGVLSMPAILTDQGAAAGTLQITLPGQAPQGVALTFPAGAVWQDDPFLPLFLVWEVSYRAFEKGAQPGANRYDTSFVSGHFQLDENTIDLVPGAQPPATQAGAITLNGAIPLSSRAADPLLDQIRKYLVDYPGENPQLQKIIDRLHDKPLLSQGLSGINPALLSRAQGLQLLPFDPFYDSEAPAGRLSTGTDTLDYANVLTHFVGQAVAAMSDEVPQSLAGYNPLRSGYLNIVRADVVDVFGRKRRVIDASVPGQSDRVIVSAPMLPPKGVSAQVSLPPRLAQAARLQFDWMSAADEHVVTNDHPATSPVCGWIVSNYLDYSLMLFAPSGRPLGSLGVFGGQTQVAWQSAPGYPARPIEQDLGAPELAHFLKFALFVHRKPRAFFDDLMNSIEGAFTYILPDAQQSDQPYAVLMGRPLALVRAGLRLEFSGLPAFASDLASVRAAMAANGTSGAYDWTQRNAAGLLDVDFPVRLGDRNHLSDGLVAYLIDGPDPYDTIYAPASSNTEGTGVRRPAADTLRLKLHASLDPPATAFADTAAQLAALRDAKLRAARKPLTLLIDPRASVHATLGILPVKAASLPAEIYARALEAIEVAFFTHPILRGAQGLALPVPAEAGFIWRWTMGVKSGGAAQPHDEDLLEYLIGDRAHFSFSPQIAQDGWLKLTPKPKQSGS